MAIAADRLTAIESQRHVTVVDGRHDLPRIRREVDRHDESRADRGEPRDRRMLPAGQPDDTEQRDRDQDREDVVPA